MKVIFRNSKLVFEKCYILQEFTKTSSKYLNLEGVESELPYRTNYVTNELPARDYIISGSFAHETDRYNVCWYDAEHNFISGQRLVISNLNPTVVNYQLKAPDNAVYMRVAEVYSPGSNYDVALELKYLD